MTDPHSESLQAQTKSIEASKEAQVSTGAQAGPIPGVSICVVGGGYVGLVTAAGFAEFGHNVVCVEIDPGKLDELRRGVVPFYEPELAELVQKNVDAGRLDFSDDFAESAKKRKAIFVAVGTPQSSEGRADKGALEAVAEQCAESLEPDQVVVIKSTAPVGTAKWLKGRLAEAFGSEAGAPKVISNPEFLREGTAVYDFFNPQRIVIGGECPTAVELISHIHRLGMREQAPIVVTNNETAEMIKYASNVFLATKIGFVNELARFCDTLGVNVMEVARAMGLDSRIGAEFLQPGPGWGGSCLPKDIAEYTGLAKAHGLDMQIARGVEAANESHFDWVAEKTMALIEESSNPTVGAFGLAFKAGTSDTRRSPAVEVIRRLRQRGVKVRVYDPHVRDEKLVKALDIELAGAIEDVADNADCLVILTEWSEFQFIDWEGLGSRMRARNIVDARNLLPPELLKRHGFKYESIGQF